MYFDPLLKFVQLGILNIYYSRVIKGFSKKNVQFSMIPEKEKTKENHKEEMSYV